SPLGEVLKATLPPGGTGVRAKLRRFVRTTDLEPIKITDGQQRVLDVLRENGSMPLQALVKEANVSAATVSSLGKKGLVEVFDAAVRRDPLAHTSGLPAEDYTLTPAQTAVVEKIQAQVAEERYVAVFLHGVTGSGKTEIYIRAMHAALERGRSAMMLVPEIALTPVFSRRLRSHFGDQVAIFHSSLSKGERFDEWMR